MIATPKQLPVSNFKAGLAASFRAIGYTLSTPSLLFYIFLIVLINGALIGGLLVWGWSFLDPLMAMLQKHATGSGIVSWILKQMLSFGTILKLMIGLFVVLFVVPTVFPILANLNPLTSILLTKMFEVTFQKETRSPLPEYYSLSKGLLVSLYCELRKLFASLLLFFLAFLFSLFPMIGTILGPVLFTIIGAQFAGWSFVTTYYEGLGYSYPQQKEAMRRQRFALWGLGVVAIIPALNMAALFTGPVGGALFAAESHKDLKPG